MAMGRELSTRPKQVENPTVKANLGTERVLRLSIAGFVLVALLFNVYQSSKGWHVELDTHHGFRQAQTALTTVCLPNTARRSASGISRRRLRLRDKPSAWRQREQK